MIVPDPRTGFPLTGNLIQPKIPPVYGPGVPEFQETIQIRPRAVAGKNINLNFTAIDYDEGGSIFGSPYALFTLYIRSGNVIGTEAPDDPDDLVVEEREVRTVGV